MSGKSLMCRYAALMACGLVWSLAVGAYAPAHAGLTWCDGSHDAATAPPGKLLSDNEGYWGDCILTGVEYKYAVPPTNPADIWRDDAKKFGRRLLDGHASGNWWVPVGINNQPLVVIFDFKRPCTFREIDISTRSKKVLARIETADSDQGPWQPAFERGREQCPEAEFHRLQLAAPAAGRYLRLTVDAGGITWLDEVLVWGDAASSDKTPEAYQPFTPTPVVTGIAFPSIPGIQKTSFSDAQYWDWQRAIGAEAKQPAVWSLAPAWSSITDRPLLPRQQEIIHQVELSLARNQTESSALVLTNTSMEKPLGATISLSAFRRVSDGKPASAVTGQLRVAGAIGSREYGTNLGPLFEANNIPGRSLMLRYLTNGAGIANFPHIALPPAGSAVFWLSITTAGAEPGLYEARLTNGGTPVRVRAQVFGVTLPHPFVWLQTWSGTTSMFPFVYDDRQQREIAYKQSIGVTVWNGFPTPGSDAAEARKHGRCIFHVWGIEDWGNKLYGGGVDPAKLTDKDAEEIAGIIRGHVQQANQLGLSYDDWYVELTDEPGRGNSAAFGALARLIRKADPKVRIYCNPSFWEGNGVLGDEDVFKALSPWYRECVDVSSPLFLLLRDHPKSLALFDAPRRVRGFYMVSTQSAKSERAEQVELYTRQAWDAFARGWNGWGFYSYFAPRGNPWNDFDVDWYGEDMPDYQMVYPGPRGPIATRQSEAVREGWQDYCLLTLLKQRGMQTELQAILKAYSAGESLPALRLRALRAAGR